MTFYINIKMAVFSGVCYLYPFIAGVIVEHNLVDWRENELSAMGFKKLNIHSRGVTLPCYDSRDLGKAFGGDAQKWIHQRILQSSVCIHTYR